MYFVHSFIYPYAFLSFGEKVKTHTIPKKLLKESIKYYRDMVESKNNPDVETVRRLNNLVEYGKNQYGRTY